MHNDDFPTTEGMTDREVLARQSASRRVTVKPRTPVKSHGNVLCERFTHPFDLHMVELSPAHSKRRK